MSCSDKLARWALLGLQGSLLGSLLAAPIRLSTLTVGLPPTLASAQGAAQMRQQCCQKSFMTQYVKGRGTLLTRLS